jgi:integrase
LRYRGRMRRAGTGHIERLPSGSYRVHVYAGTDPLTGRPLRFKETVKTEEQAQIALGRLLEQAAAGRRPDSGVTVAGVLARYLAVAELDLSTRETYEGYIRRTIMPALGSMELRKIRGPMLDTFYARLRRCGDLACTGRPFTEHSSFPVLVIQHGDRRPAWHQVADTIREAIHSGRLAPGAQLPSVRALAAQHVLPVATLQRALAALATEGVISVRQGRRAVVTGEAGQAPPQRPRADASHNCARAGCRQHQCRPMSAMTIRQIHSILSGAFTAAVRWEWIDRNPAGSAKLPKTRHRSPTSPTPAAVASVIAAARDLHLELLALYMWLAAVTGARRGELCGLQWADIDLDGGLVHIAFSYLVRSGQKMRKDTKTHQDRHLAIDAITVTVLAERKRLTQALLASVDVKLTPTTAYVFSSDPLGLIPWNPDWVTHKVAEVAEHAGVSLNIKALRHYTASQLLAGGIDLRNTAARLGHGGGGATTLRHYADPVSEVDRRAAAYLAQLTTPASDGETDAQAELSAKGRL